MRSITSYAKYCISSMKQNNDFIQAFIEYLIQNTDRYRKIGVLLSDSLLYQTQNQLAMLLI